MSRRTAEDGGTRVGLGGLRLITTGALCLSLISCSSLPFNGAVLERAMESRDEVEPVSCQCNVTNEVVCS